MERVAGRRGLTVSHLGGVVENSAIAAVKAGERHTESEIFEVGVDIVVDDAGTAWVLELNSRPG